MAGRSSYLKNAFEITSPSLQAWQEARNDFRICQIDRTNHYTWLVSGNQNSSVGTTAAWPTPTTEHVIKVMLSTMRFAAHTAIATLCFFNFYSKTRVFNTRSDIVNDALSISNVIMAVETCSL